MAAPELLTALLNAPGPSGHEEEPARLWPEAASLSRDQSFVR
jgi:putative aminopeptidase FrvX